MRVSSVADRDHAEDATLPAPHDDERWTMDDGTDVVIRPIAPADEQAMARFHQSLSPDSVYARYLNVLKLSQRIAHDRLARVCHPDAALDAVLVAEVVAPNGNREIVGIGRLAKLQGQREGEVALIVSDSHQRRGLGTELLRRLIAIAKEQRLTHLFARTLLGNAAMVRVCQKAGMRLSDQVVGGSVKASLTL